MALRDADEVIEKREANPVTIAALIVSVVAILAAMAIQVVEIADYGTSDAQGEIASDLHSFKSKVTDAITYSREGGDEDALDDFEGEDEGDEDDEDDEEL